LTWGYPSPKKRKKREAKKEEEKISLKNWGSVHRQCLA